MFLNNYFSDLDTLLRNSKNDFSKLIDCEKVYTKAEFNNILTQVFKNIKNNKTKNTNGVKKPPTKYNIFIKDNMGLLKKENPELNRQELMKLASTKWNIHKINNKEEEKGDILEEKKDDILEEKKDDILEENKGDILEENKGDILDEKDDILEDKKVKKSPKKRVVAKKND